MKYRTTKKAVNNSYGLKICVGYCNIQFLLGFKSPVAYTARSEGWAADIYDFGNVAIITGYAPFGNIRPKYDICRHYDEQAKNIRYDYSLSYEQQEQQINKLLNEFIEEVTSNDNGI